MTDADTSRGHGPKSEKGQIYRLLQEAPGRLLDKLTDEWAIDEADAWLLGAELEPLTVEAIEADDLIALELLFDDLVERFAQWRSRFIANGKGKPRYITAEFHKKWIRSILKARFLGNKQMILSPPRHGKFELLVDFATWNIVRFPNIRIVWVCASKDIAENMSCWSFISIRRRRRISTSVWSISSRLSGPIHMTIFVEWWMPAKQRASWNWRKTMDQMPEPGNRKSRRSLSPPLDTFVLVRWSSRIRGRRHDQHGPSGRK